MSAAEACVPASLPGADGTAHAEQPCAEIIGDRRFSYTAGASGARVGAGGDGGVVAEAGFGDTSERAGVGRDVATCDRAGEGPPEVPAKAYATALAGLPGMGPSRLAAILGAEPPVDAWRRIRAGQGWTDRRVLRTLAASGPGLVDRWRASAAGVDPASCWARVLAARVGVALLGTPGYPSALADDVEPPAVLFHQGALGGLDGLGALDGLDALGRKRVAIVGTRRCSTTGAGMAFELGRDLAAAGVSVVSGLAAGIDGAAHRGALAAASGAQPVGVVGSGLDVVYPARQVRLWRAVLEAGVLLSEAPLGARPERWRFPARNRIIAALADLVVVVESHRRGGSLHTVDEADRRGIDVFAVPGSVRNPAAVGTNELLAEGRPPVCSVDDLLVALDLTSTPRAGIADRRRLPEHADRPVLDAVGWQPSTLDQIVLRTGLGLGMLAPALDRLCEAGWVARTGGWYERIAATGGQR
jgi:DNA processing protein